MKFGLVGDQVKHSFSKDYFGEKFTFLGLSDFSYDLISVDNAEGVRRVLARDYFGLNVTKPYKSDVIPFLDAMDTEAQAIGAVNTLVRTGAKTWKGYNTDCIGFEQSLLTWLAVNAIPENALILGSGGASKAVRFVLDRLGVHTKIVSASGRGDLSYDDLDSAIMKCHHLIVNTTPLGMEPDFDSFPLIPFVELTPEHCVFDLVYNPTNTVFLTRSQQAGAKVKGGLEMLHLQADYAWSIWKSYGKF